MNEPEIKESMVEFHEEFVEALDAFIVKSVEIGEEEFDLDPNDAFSMIASRMLFIVIRGAVKGGATKETLMETISTAFDITKLSLAEPEGGVQ